MSLLHNITIGASGLAAASSALSATSQNVVNASTPTELGTAEFLRVLQL